MSLGYQDAESKEAIVPSCLKLGSMSWRDVYILESAVHLGISAFPGWEDGGATIPQDILNNHVEVL